MPAPTADAEWGFPNPATPPGSSAFYSVLFAPQRLRDDLAALLGWRHVIGSVVDQVSDPGVAARKLEWWQGELDRIFSAAGGHPLSRSLAPLIRRSKLPKQPFVDVIWGTEAVLTDRRVKDFEALAAWADLDQGALFELIARGHGESRPEILSGARRAGAYCALVDLLRRSGRLLRQGRSGFLPGDRLALYGLSHAEAAVPSNRARLPPILAEIAEDLAGHDEDLDLDLRRLPVTIRIRVRLMDRLLAELAASRFELIDQHIALTSIRKLWNAWRESQRRERT
jgi:15-cis-phytoene synthase